MAVNGVDSPIWIKPDGTIERLIAGDGTTANTISGIDPVKFIHVYSHQKRIWFVEKESTSGWYLPPNVLYGIAKQFDFGPNWTRGGYLTQIITWTIDDGNGADDHLAAISSEGEVSIYQGTDPDNADTWTLQGVYFAGVAGRSPRCRPLRWRRDDRDRVRRRLHVRPAEVDQGESVRGELEQVHPAVGVAGSDRTHGTSSAGSHSSSPARTW